MRWRALVLVALLPSMGCSLAYCGDGAFLRDAELRTGEIRGRALLPDGLTAARYAQGLVRGTSFVRRTDGEGVFVFSGLEAGPWIVQVTDDEDGNGIPERRRVLHATLREVPHRRSPSYVPFVGGEGTPELSGIDVGQVVLEGTTKVRGQVLVEASGGARVPPSEAGQLAVVIAGRNLDLPRLESPGFDLVALGAEAKTGADATGAFELPNVSGGSFYLLVLLYDEGSEPGLPGALAMVSEPVFVRADDDELDLDRAIVLSTAVGAPARRSLQMVFSPAPAAAEEVYLVFAPPGKELPPCEATPPTTYESTPFDHALVTAAVAAAGSVVFNDAPVGVWDVQSCFTTSPPGVLYEQPVSPETAAEEPVLMGPMLLTDVQACVPSRPCDVDADCAEGLSCDAAAGRCRADDEGYRDCDGDGARGLPKLVSVNDPNVSLWSGCTAACFDAGEGLALDEECEVDGTRYDCDDDGDGQPDVTESQECYGVGRGTDADGDGLCDGTDSWPLCRANTAAACEAGKEPDRPQIVEDYQGGTAMVCPAARVASSAFCEAGPADGATCNVAWMVCGAQPLNEPPPYCDVEEQLGCPAQMDCVPEITNDGVRAACAYREGLFDCQAEQQCPPGFDCAERADGDRTYWTCISDTSLPLVEADIFCTCCDTEGCAGGEPFTIEEPGATLEAGFVCTGDKLAQLWNRCNGAATAPRGDAGPPAGADAGVDTGGDVDAGPSGQLGCPLPQVEVCDVDLCTCDDPCGDSARTFTIIPPFTPASLLELTSAHECLKVEGTDTLLIDAYPNANLTLQRVVVLDAHLTVQNNSALLSLNAIGLRLVNGDMKIRDNFGGGAGLQGLSLFALEKIAGSLSVERNPWLMVPPFFGSVEVAGTRTIAANGCNTAEDCFAPQDLCDTIALGDLDNQQVCHQCQEDLDCTSPQTCDTLAQGSGSYLCQGAN